MDVNDYVKSEHYAAVIETDRGVMINGTFIPCVSRNGVKCEDTRNELHEVTITFMTDTFIRMAGKPSKEFEEGHGYKPQYSFTEEANKKKC